MISHGTMLAHTSGKAVVNKNGRSTKPAPSNRPRIHDLDSCLREVLLVPRGADSTMRPTDRRDLRIGRADRQPGLLSSEQHFGILPGRFVIECEQCPGVSVGLQRGTQRGLQLALAPT